jgi:osmotically-inducible protein OsmY
VNEGLIDVNVDGGKVTLSGSVGSATEKRQAYMDAWIVGVKSVTSDGLEVIPVFADEMLRKDKTVIKTDAEIKKAVKDALLYDPRVFSFNVDVEVDNRIVTLKGKVNNLKAKRLAEQDAMNTAGVFNVRNLIKVRLLEAPADEIIAGNVRSAIEWDPFLERHEITVIVRNKKAYIYGVVDSYFEKEHAEDVASRVFGVADVQNNITVGYVWPFKSDAKIKNDVEGQLFWSLLVDSDDIDIEVNNGVVTLTGKVNNWSELDAAVRNAFEGGAWRVKSEMEIEGQEVTYPATYYYYSYNNEWIS